MKNTLFNYDSCLKLLICGTLYNSELNKTHDRNRDSKWTTSNQGINIWLEQEPFFPQVGGNVDNVRVDI